MIIHVYMKIHISTGYFFECQQHFCKDMRTNTFVQKYTFMNGACLYTYAYMCIKTYRYKNWPQNLLSNIKFSLIFFCQTHVYIYVKYIFIYIRIYIHSFPLFSFFPSICICTYIYIHSVRTKARVFLMSLFFLNIHEYKYVHKIGPTASAAATSRLRRI